MTGTKKLVITVQTPAGAVSRAAVQAIEWSGLTGTAKEAVSALQRRSTSWKIRGEAAVVEVAPGKYLFALLRGTGGFVGNPGENLAYTLLIKNGGDGYVGTAETIDLVRDLAPETPVAPPPEALPVLVTFTDINDPKSVVLVDPTDLAATFGSGVALTAVTLEMTDDPVTEGRDEGVLGWPRLYPESPILPKVEPTDFSFAAKMRRGSFIRRQ